MQVTSHDAARFRALAEPFYRRDPVAHTVELAGLAAPELPADAVLLTVCDGGRVIGAAVRTPPYPLVCALPVDAAGAVAAVLADVAPGLPAVRGPRPGTEALAQAWVRRTGATVAGRTEERLHVLGDLAAPAGVAGRARAGDAGDGELLADWSGRFFAETFGVPGVPAHGFVTAQRTAGSRFVLWLRDGMPVSLAMVRRPAAGVARIGPVYTPGAHRGHGYASAVTAAAAQQARAAGAADVVLFTDVANPVAGALYRRLGFVPRADWLAVDFAP
ncbi:GNAT family N-acetyltransferase [Mycolicibacterium grossiae]|uniref:GNAT family N-acetyltransferase n=2 Tax=Mycolicibacterium grossiae TaxID=1552759 RepID=UPI0011F10FA7|nr:GNAT family N-acetyltransferase [Mycolicibacterium grossiae]QEM46712.1 GNAT family N-acetyltransferase [Mycolicibacterium grossiae]